MEIEFIRCMCGYESSFTGLIGECPECGLRGTFYTLIGEYGTYMTTEEYAALVDYIYEYHGWRRMKGRKIKYVRGNFDTRTGMYFAVQLDNVNFAINNENRHRNLKKWIMEYLNEYIE